MTQTGHQKMETGTLVYSDKGYISKAHFAVAKFGAANAKVVRNLDMIRNKSQVAIPSPSTRNPSTFNPIPLTLNPNPFTLISES